MAEMQVKSAGLCVSGARHPGAVEPRQGVKAPEAGVALATALLVGSSLLFAAMALLVKRVSGSLGGPQIAFVRFAVGIGACGIAAFFSRFRLHNGRGLLLRGTFGGTAVLLYFLSIAHLPVGEATLLNNTAPVFTAIFAIVFLGEATGVALLSALALATTGAVLVIRSQAPTGTWGLGLWELVGLGSAALSGAAVATIRQVRKTDGSWEIFGAFCVVGAGVTGGPAVLTWTTPTPGLWVDLIAIGLISVAAQLLMTYAMRYVRAAPAGIIAQLNPVCVLALGWLLFGDPMTPCALAGAALAIAGIGWAAYLEPRANAATGDALPCGPQL